MSTADTSRPATSGAPGAAIDGGEPTLGVETSTTTSSPTRIDRPVGIAVGLAVPVALAAGMVTGGPVVPLTVAGAGVLLGIVAVPGFWRIVGRALAAGGLAGVLVLAPGYRVAMRVVAIVDPGRTPELTLEGTLFLLVGIGLVFGAVTTAWTSLLGRTLELSRRAGAGLLTVATLVLLFADSATIAELRELGGGPWMNVPMFAGVTVGFAALADRWARPDATTRRIRGRTSHRGEGTAMMIEDGAGRGG